MRRDQNRHLARPIRASAHCSGSTASASARRAKPVGDCSACIRFSAAAVAPRPRDRAYGGAPVVRSRSRSSPDSLRHIASPRVRPASTAHSATSAAHLALAMRKWFVSVQFVVMAVGELHRPRPPVRAQAARP